MDERNQSHYRPSWIPWAITSVTLIVVALAAYAFGTQHQVVFDGDGGRHMWFFPGFGFWIFILIFFGFWRRLWWGCGPYYYGRPWRYRRYYRDPYYDDYDRADWDEWHRDAHRREERRDGPRDERPPSNL